MAKITIDESYLEELEDSFSKLQALENGGVENWTWYDESLKEYYKEKEKAESLKLLVDKIIIHVLDNKYEPSETGAGFTVDKQIENDIKGYISEFINKEYS